MPVANKEFILNYAYNRWQFNQKRNIGATSDAIRLLKPSTIDEWENYFFDNMCSRDRLEFFGKQLYEHISKDLPEENRFHPDLLSSISEQDCVNYVYDVPIRRAYEGYMRECGNE